MRSLVLLKIAIFLSRWLNLWHYYSASLLERFIRYPAWVKELSRYYQTTPQKIINQYQDKRSQTARLWQRRKRSQVKDIHSFYQETDYFVYRQNYFNHLKSFFDVAVALAGKKKGKLCEYGGGVGPVTNWCINKFPGWHYHIVDLPCPVLAFSRWRFKQKKNVSFGEVAPGKLPLKESYDVILCKQVLEHVPNPLQVIKHLVKHLNLNGCLFVDYIYHPGGENLVASARQRREVLQFLKERLTPVFAINPRSRKEGYGLYIKTQPSSRPISFTKYQTRGSFYHWSQTEPAIFNFSAYVAARYQQIVDLIPLNSRQKILDVGCGDGVLSGLIYQKTKARVTAIDNNQESIKFARKKLAAAKIKFLVASAYRLPFPDQNFDLVLATEVIEHLTKTDKFLAEAVRVLKPKGKLIISSPIKIFAKPEDRLHVKEFSVTDLKKLLRQYFSRVTITTSHPFWLKQLYLTTLLHLGRYHVDLFRWLINILVLLGYNPFIRLKGKPSQQLAVCFKVKSDL